MTSNDDFSAETVDEQIEHFIQDQSHQQPNAVLAQKLKAMCEEDRAIIERVGVRYAAHIGSQPSLDEPVLSSSPSSWTNAGAFSAVPAQQKAKPARRSWRVFTLVAAVLVAVVLVGGNLWVGHVVRRSGNLVAYPTVTPTVKPAIPPSGSPTQVVYDDKMNALLLFSGYGYTGSGPLDDTWSWDGSTWTQLHPAHAPTLRTDAALAYDPATQQVVLFGGVSADRNSPTLGDTWIWNGTDWIQQQSASSPPARAFATFAYDAATDQLVLFGGKHVIGPGPGLSDTWVWTGSSWVQQYPTTTPPARSEASLAYDAATSNLVLFGGDAINTWLNDTWIWTGSNWVQQYPATAPDLSATIQGQSVTFDNPSMVYNPAMGQLMLTLFGIVRASGTNVFHTQADWVWDGNNWTEVNATGPDVYVGYVFYDEHLHTIYEITDSMSQSANMENNLWKWTGHTWVIVESW